MQVNIDDFFREQNDAFKVDGSNMDMHWQQMNQKLQAAAKPPVQKKYKPLFIGAALVSLIIIGFLWMNRTPATVKEDTFTNTPVISNKTSTEPAKAVVKEIAIATPANAAAPEKEILPVKKAGENKPLPVAVASKQSISNTINKAAKFYIDLTREPELFTINPAIENRLTCKQGTTINIPANVLIDAKGNKVSETVSVIVQEYYRYEDDQNKTTADAGMIKYGFFLGTERLQVPDIKIISIKMKSVIDGAEMKVISNEDAIPESKLTALSWVSSEYFTTNKGEKIDYKITLDKKFDASTFMSEIAFPKQNVIMAGDIDNNSIIFHNVPVGETVFFMSIGKIKDKYFSCSKKLITGNAKITDLDFIEISAQLYKQQIDLLNKMGKEQ